MNPYESAAYMEGREAGLVGAYYSDNPYAIGSDDAMYWEDWRAEGERQGEYL